MERVRIALLGDGAEWLWNAMTQCFPNAREVLDYYHCAEHIHKVAKLQYGDTLDAQQWAEATITRLFMGRQVPPSGVLNACNPVARRPTKRSKS